MTEVLDRLTKARAEANAAKNDASRAVYAIDAAIKVAQEPTPVVTPAAPGRTLPAMKGNLVLWNYGLPWAAAEWAKGGGVYPWKAANALLAKGDLRLAVTPGAAGSVQANTSEMSLKALFEVEATTQAGVSGLIQSPLYLFGDVKVSNDEADFEVLGVKGMQLALHAGGQANVFVKLIPGDFSGFHKYGIRYEAGALVVWYLDGEEICRATPADCAGGKFPTHPMKPFAEIWASTSGNAWAGVWKHEDCVMDLHGYQRTAL